MFAVCGLKVVTISCPCQLVPGRGYGMFNGHTTVEEPCRRGMWDNLCDLLHLDRSVL